MPLGVTYDNCNHRERRHGCPYEVLRSCATEGCLAQVAGCGPWPSESESDERPTSGPGRECDASMLMWERCWLDFGRKQPAHLIHPSSPQPQHQIGNVLVGWRASHDSFVYILPSLLITPQIPAGFTFIDHE